MKKKYKIILISIILLFFFIMIVSWVFSIPKIYSIDPSIAGSGSTIYIRGRSFQKNMENNFVSIDGKKISMNYYKQWSNKVIELNITDEIKSGFLTVTTYFGTSNYKIFSKKENLQIKDKDLFSTSIAGRKINIKRGGIAIINGTNIPLKKSDSKIFIPIATGDQYKLNQKDYILWSQDFIKIKVPYLIKDNGIIRVLINNREFKIPFFIKDSSNIVKVFKEKDFSIKYVNEYVFDNLSFKDILSFYSFRLKMSNYENQIVIPKIENKYKQYGNLEFAEVNKEYNKFTDYFNIKNFSYEVKINDLNLIPKDYIKNSDYIKYTKFNYNYKIKSLKEKFQKDFKPEGFDNLHPYKKAKILYSAIYNLYIKNGKKEKGLYTILLSNLLKENGIPTRAVYTYKKSSVNPNLFNKDCYLEFYLQDFLWVPIDLKIDSFSKISNDYIILYKEGDLIKPVNFNSYIYKTLIKYDDGYYDFIIYHKGKNIFDVSSLYQRNTFINENS